MLSHLLRGHRLQAIIVLQWRFYNLSLIVYELYTVNLADAGRVQQRIGRVPHINAGVKHILGTCVFTMYYAGVLLSVHNAHAYI